MKPEISVVLPVFNAVGTLREAISSVLGQAGVAFELIVVDDSSTDNSMALASEFDDARLRVMRNAGPKGVVGAANTGICAARGAWVARMDADDLAMPGRLERQLAYACEHPESGVVAGMVEPMESCGPGMDRYIDWVNTLPDHESMAANRFIESPVVNPSAMVRRDWLGRVGGYRDVPWAEDHDLWLRLLEIGCLFGRVPELVLQWRDSPGRLTRSDPRYGEAARMTMRAHFLARMTAVMERGVVICGAGKTGKMLAKNLINEGVKVHHFLEVNPRKHGQRIHGALVKEAHQLPAGEDRPLLIGAVGTPGGRPRVRGLAREFAYREGIDYWQIC